MGLKREKKTLGRSTKHESGQPLLTIKDKAKCQAKEAEEKKPLDKTHKKKKGNW